VIALAYEGGGGGGRGEAEPVPGGRPEAAEHQLRACRGRAEPRLAFGLGGLVMLAQHGMGSGEAVVRGWSPIAGKAISAF
jgi:hypothetical protein